MKEGETTRRKCFLKELSWFRIARRPVFLFSASGSYEMTCGYCGKIKVVRLA